jgi:hypothetical protein
VTRIARAILIAAILLARPAASGEGPLTHEQMQRLLDEGQAAYDEGVALLRRDAAAARERFALAASRFEQVARTGAGDGRLQYNLANAHLQAGDLGPAILAYRIAESMRPGDERIRHNLAHARSLRRDRIEASGGRALREVLLAWHRRVSLPVQMTIFALAWAGLWTALLVRRFVRYGGAWLVAAPAAALALLAGASVAGRLAGETTRIGVVTAGETVVRKGNGTGFEPRFAEPVHEGVEFIVLEERPGWYRIELVSGADGWIPAESAAVARLTS